MLAILAESALRSLALGAAVWVGLRLFRVRDPHVQMTCWTVVLVASLAMPVLMHRATVTITLAPSIIEAPAHLWFAPTTVPETLPVAPALLGDAVPVTPSSFDWLVVATAIYAAVAGLLLLRLVLGLHLTSLLVRRATPLHAPWVENADVRVSPAIGGPVTCGSTILLPSNYSTWDVPKRQAVLAHESAHVANRDFHLLLLASLNCAVFWFSPFAWWQSWRLAELAEMISDASALEIVDDRLSYAEILLELVQHGRRSAGLHMARANTVRSRVERILDGSAALVAASWRKRLCMVAATAPMVIVSALTIGWSTPSQSIEVADGAATPAPLKGPIDFYRLGDSALVFALLHEGDELSGQLTGQRKFRLAEGPDGTLTYPAAAGPIRWTLGADRHPAEMMLNADGREERAIRIASIAQQATAADPALKQASVGWYELTPTRVLAVTQDGDRLLARETNGAPSELTASGDTFSGTDGRRLIFLRDSQGKVSQVLTFEPIPGARLARRIDAARAAAIEADAARRLAEVPDRFARQVQQEGSKEAVLNGIADLRNGTPNYDRMTAPLAAKIRRQAALMIPMMQTYGAVETIFFRGVGPGGYDIFGVKFEHGSAEVRLLLSADGKVEDVVFRPDGDGTPGRILDCASEPGLKAPGGAVPISVSFYNDTGGEMQLFELDADGTRAARGLVEKGMSSTVWTSVGRPWIVADSSGGCLQVVLPGRRTRFNTVENTVEARQGNGVQQQGALRTIPVAGSDQMLRQYIEGISRGQPNYDLMTAAVANYTRRELQPNQAILNKLGELQSVSFRGVSGAGSDIYVAHFTHGTAEWRIGLSKDRTIGRIAIGPQY
jgi:beta-lactamase regulating signal transducer with metallopeptidase domain